MKVEKLSLDKFIEYDNHEAVYSFHDEDNDFQAFIAIHNTQLGPAVGGTRMYAYSDITEALRDVLRLSRAMTYKCTLANVPYGGGKGVIVGSPDKKKTEENLKLYAEAVSSLGGVFYTGEDVGISEQDVALMLSYSPYFIGKSNEAGDPSPWAALGVFYAIKEAASVVWPDQPLSNKKIGIKGLGKVGSALTELLLKDEVSLLVTDIDETKQNTWKDFYPQVEIVPNGEIKFAPVDIYAPCALGSEFKSDDIPRLKMNVICGAANNQLVSDDVGDELFQRGIWYVPDYVANAGGLINVVDELARDGYSRNRVIKNTERIAITVRELFTVAREKNVAPHRLANEYVLGKLLKRE